MDGGHLGVVLDGEVLAAHHTVVLEAHATELLSSAVRLIHPLDGDRIVLDVLRAELEGVAGERREDGILRVEHAARWVHALHVGGLEGPSDATTTSVDQTQAQIDLKLSQPSRPARSGCLTSDLNQQRLIGYEKTGERAHGQAGPGVGPARGCECV